LLKIPTRRQKPLEAS
jgi:hypothetical protein